VPELPDVEVYAQRLNALYAGRPLQQLRIKSVFLLRSAEVSPGALAGKRLRNVTRLGKRLVWAFDGSLYAVLHLMIAGRLHRKPPGAVLGSKQALAAWDFEDSSIVLTEAGSKRRASLYLVDDERLLEQFDRGGLEPLACSSEQFAQRMRLENRTLKRALTDPRLMSGIGNAYSDEMLHRAQLSPVKLTSSLTDEELERLHSSMQQTLIVWRDRLREAAADGFPEKVTAFHPQMAVHGRYGQPCPVCATKVQRIRHANNEVNYCPTCQTSGRLLADRALSRLLKGDWPKTLEELEELKQPKAVSPRGVSG